MDFLCKSREIWLQTGLCSWLYKKSKTHFRNNEGSFMRALIGLCITLAIVTTIHIQSTLCVCFFKRHLIGLQCPVTIETKSHLIHIEAFSWMWPLTGLYPPVTTETKAAFNPHCWFFFNEASYSADLLQ